MRQDQAWVAQAIGQVYNVVSKAGVNLIGELKAVEENDFVIANPVLLIISSVPQRDPSSGGVFVSSQTMFTQFPQLGYPPEELRVEPSDWFPIPRDSKTMERYLIAKNAGITARSGLVTSGPSLKMV